MSATVPQLLALALLGGTLLISFAIWCRIAWDRLTVRAEGRGVFDSTPRSESDLIPTDANSSDSSIPDAAAERSLFPWEPDRTTKWPLIGALATAAMAAFYLTMAVLALLTSLGTVSTTPVSKELSGEVMNEATGEVKDNISGEVVETVPKDGPEKVTVPGLQKQSLLVLSVSLVLFLALATSPTIPLKQLGFSLQNVPRQIGDGLLGFLLAIGPVMLCMGCISPFRTVENTHPFLQALGENGGGELWLWVTITAVIGAAISEELFFRVALQGLLETRLPGSLAIGISTLFFCAVHGFPDMIALIPLASILGYIFHRRRSFLAVVVTHSTFNGFMLLLTALMAA